MTRLSTADKITLLGNLATMLGAGIPILEAVNSLLEDTRGNQKKILVSLRDDLIQGKPIHTSLERFPAAFDKVTLNLIKAAEEAGTLETTLEDVREYIQKEVEFVDKVKFALVYPVLVGIVFIVILILILVFVIPRIADVFAQLQLQLPLPTRIMIWLSDVLRFHTLALGLGTLVICSLAGWLYYFHLNLVKKVLTGLPGIAIIIRQVDLTRFARSMQLLLQSGVPIASALELAGEVVMNKGIAALLGKTREVVIAGKRLSEGLRGGSKAVPVLVLKLIEAGEKTGTLDKSMGKIATQLEYQVSGTLKLFITILEPVMLIVVGLSVGGMILSIIGPLYGLISQVTVR